MSLESLTSSGCLKFSKAVAWRSDSADVSSAGCRYYSIVDGKQVKALGLTFGADRKQDDNELNEPQHTLEVSKCVKCWEEVKNMCGEGQQGSTVTLLTSTALLCSD